MNTTEVANANQRIKCPRWLGGICCGLGIPIAHGVIPWAISLLTVRHGWVDHHPGIWNWFGLLPVAVGIAGLVWAMALHFVAAPGGWKFKLTPDYLLTRGPYAYTRNPIALSELALWLGWAGFYGSIPVLLTLPTVGLAIGSRILASEERSLEARFGEAYREYKRTVPRLLGTSRRRKVTTRKIDA